MGRTLTYATNTLSTFSIPASDRPICAAGWVRASTTSTNHSVVEMINSVGGNAIFLLRLQDTPDLVAQMFVRSDSNTNIGTPQSSTNYSTGQWHHIVGVWGGTHTTIWLDGGGKTTVANNAADASLTLDTLTIQTTGDTAEIAIWQGIELDDDDVDELYTGDMDGFSPLLVRPDNLMAYWPLLDDDGDRDRVGDHDLTANGTPTYATTHPGILYPTAPQIVIAQSDAAPATASGPIAAYHRNMQRRRSA